MGKDESGDLKTPLKHKIFIKIYTMCLKGFNPWKDFSNESNVDEIVIDANMVLMSLMPPPCWRCYDDAEDPGDGTEA